VSKKPFLKLRNLTKIYKTGSTSVKALDNVTIEINEGDFIAIMGPSGSGKSTLLNILGTLDYSYNGEYSILNERIHEKSAGELAKIRGDLIGFIFQEFALLPRYTAIGNVALPLTYKGMTGRKKTEAALSSIKKLNMENRKDHKPSQLSGGEQQRIAIARALVNHPKLLLADEPTGNLDTKTGKMIMEILQKLNDEGLTIILVTHDTNMARYAKKILLMVDGKLSKEENVSH
jgi:putative ABC transport system ATP-binding protein